MQVHVLMKDEKEGRKKQARSNKQTRQSNTAHPRQSLFLGKNELHVPQVGLNPRHSILQTEHSTIELPRQLSWLGPNLTSHNKPDERAYLHVQVHVHVHNTRLHTCTCTMYIHVQYLLE